MLNIIVPIRTITSSDIKFLWNIFFRYQYNLAPIKFSKKDIILLNKESTLHGYKVPYFLKVTNFFFEKEYLKKAYIKESINYKSFEFYLIAYIFYVHKLYFSNFKFLPNKISKWLNSTHIKIKGNVNFSKAFFQIYNSDNSLNNLKLDRSEDLLKILFNIYLYYVPNIPFYSDLNSEIHNDLYKFLDKTILKVNTKNHNFEISNLMLAWYLVYKDENLKIKNISEDTAYFIYNLFTKEVITSNKVNMRRKVNTKSYFKLIHLDKRNNVLSFSSFKNPAEKVTQGSKNKSYSRGVNVVGWPNLQIGIGEDGRSACYALSSAKINFSLNDVSQILPTQATKKYFSFYSKYFKSKNNYQTDLCYLDLATLHRYYFYMKANGFHMPKKIIGVCPWELSSWPKHLNFVFDNIDIFFASSKFIFDTFKEFIGNKNIFLVRPVIHVPTHFINNFDIENLNEPFTFINIFDGLSSIDRKNPDACAKAFIKAFPRHNKDVRLIIKMMHVDMSSYCLKPLLDIIKNDDRIQIINKSVTKNELFKLINNSHCFVSLHRSEGLGRNIGESMLFGRPTIVSNYSGNVDFCTYNTSFLVDGKLIKVADKYSNSQPSSVWFDPNLESAVEALRSVFYDRSNAKIISRNGKEFIEKNYSINTAGDRYKELLLDLLT
jgi:hypothetical protein